MGKGAPSCPWCAGCLQSRLLAGLAALLISRLAVPQLPRLCGEDYFQHQGFATKA